MQIQDGASSTERASVITAMEWTVISTSGPQLAPDTAAFIAELDPKPADLRRRKGLRLQSDMARARIIREGHLGTGMFPDTTMTDQDLKDTLAYLGLLRKQGYPSKRIHP